MQLSAAAPINGLSCEQALAALQSSPQGLSSREALNRLQRLGPNRLPPQRQRPLILRLTDQLTHFMALLLWTAGGMAFLARTPELGWAIWSVVLINAIFSFWQEFQAERTLLASPTVVHLEMDTSLPCDGVARTAPRCCCFSSSIAGANADILARRLGVCEGCCVV